ncbi:MAG TPA: hypothetical protein VHB98_02265, partial [Chloroflexota bacterium]|nr:hypothetical protein [Chloroflexota bacterium]
MSAVAGSDHSPIVAARRFKVWHRLSAARSQEDGLSTHASENVTTVRRMLFAVMTSLLLALVLDARGIVHSGDGMQDGPMRTVTLTVGNAALWIAEATRLDWPWDELHTALGYKQQPAVAPLLASGADDGAGAGGGAALAGSVQPAGAAVSPTPAPTFTPRPRRPFAAPILQHKAHPGIPARAAPPTATATTTVTPRKVDSLLRRSPHRPPALGVGARRTGRAGESRSGRTTAPVHWHPSSAPSIRSALAAATRSMTRPRAR